MTPRPRCAVAPGRCRWRSRRSRAPRGPEQRLSSRPYPSNTSARSRIFPDNYIRTDRIQIKDAPLPEYDPLADLYDLEYPHHYDVPFWLALAERERGPIVEWGAGTGRIAIPLAEAGFEVTAVELSERMVEVGRKKGGSVQWVSGDMRSAKLGRRYKLAVCAFNSFLCLLKVADALAFRSEERRVGKECRSRWSPYH